MSRRRKVTAKHSERTEPPVATRRSWFEPAGLVLVLLTTFLVYLPALRGGVLWDDVGHITKPSLQSIDGLYRIWFDVGATQQYYPLLHTAFWLEHKLWGDSMLGYHLVNVLWHLVAITLVYAILKKLKIPGALLAAAIFAVHPVMVESVAWITEQKNTLSAVFYLSAMLIYLKFDESRLRSHYFIAFGLFALGLLTKTVTATLPAALLVIFWWQRGTLSWQRDIRPLVPFFLCGAAAGVLTAWFERKLIGAEGAGYEMAFLDRCLLAGRVVWFYLSKLVWPTNLIFIYPHWTIDRTVWWQWLFPIATLAVLFVLWAIRGKSRAPLAGWLLFVGTLFPVLGFLNVFPFIYSYVADHFQYLASLGMIVLAASVAARGLAHLPQSARWLGFALPLLLIAILAVLSARQARMYSDLLTLYQTTLARNPECWMAHNNLGELLAKTNRDEGLAHFQEALRLRPEYPEALNNMGYELMQAGRFQEAVGYLEHSVQAKSDFATSRNNLGIALFSLNKVPQSIEQFQMALKFNANDAKSHANLANVFSRISNFDESIAHYEEAVRLLPEVVEFHYGLAVALAGAGRHNEAIAEAVKGIGIGHSTHQGAATEQLEEWLKQYQTELQRAGAVPASEPPLPIQQPTQSK